MAEPSQEDIIEEFKQLHSSECLSDKRCRCGDALRRWRVLKESPNRGRIFLKCQGAWPGDPSGLSPFCLDWLWEDELDPVPGVFSFGEEYMIHPDARAYFDSQDFMKRNRLKILDLTGRDMVSGDVGVVRALVHREKRKNAATQTELTLVDQMNELDMSREEFSLRLTPSPSNSTPYDSLKGSPNTSRYDNKTESGDEVASQIDYNTSPEDD